MSKERKAQLNAFASMIRAELAACQATARTSDDMRDIEEAAHRLNKAVNRYVMEYTKQPAA